MLSDVSEVLRNSDCPLTEVEVLEICMYLQTLLGNVEWEVTQLLDLPRILLKWVLIESDQFIL